MIEYVGAAYGAHGNAMALCKAAKHGAAASASSVNRV